MEHTLPWYASSQVSSIARAFNLNQFLSVLLLLSTMFLVMILSARTAAKPQPPVPNPMLAFADVFPGQPRAAVQARGFSCSVTEYKPDGSPLMEDCVLNQTTGAFSAIKLIISDNVVSLIRFVFCQNTFRVGDFVLLFGKPRMHRQGEWTYFTWYSRGVLAIAPHQLDTKYRIPHTLAVHWISFTDTAALYQMT
jgi:hypothetical protein